MALLRRAASKTTMNETTSSCDPLTLTIVIPVLNESQVLPQLIKQLRLVDSHQVVFVDGGSSDSTVEQIQAARYLVLSSAPGRAQQMNVGAQIATGDVLVFLHADTQVPEGLSQLINQALTKTDRVWGRFDVRISGRSPLLAIIGFMMNWRSRMTGIATGDQVMFVRRSVFETLGGFADIGLMEDIELSKRLTRVSRPVCLFQRVTTSGRRWQKRGVLKTIVLMWWLRLAYWLGVKPSTLARWYR